MVEQTAERILVKHSHFIDVKDENHLLRIREIERRIALFVAYGVKGQNNLVKIFKAEKERFGTLEGCGCASCAKLAVKNANTVVASLPCDKYTKEMLSYNLVIDKKGNASVRINEEAFATPNPELKRLPAFVASDFEDDNWNGF